MFKFLKNKLKEAISKISSRIEIVGEEETAEKKPTADELVKEAEAEIKEEKKIEREIEKEFEEELKEIPAEQIHPKAEEKLPEKEEPVIERITSQDLERERLERERLAEEERKRKEAEAKVKEKLERKELPTIQELAEASRSEKKGFFSKLKEAIVTKKIDESQFDEIFWDLELVLLENNVAVEVIEKIKSGLKAELVDKQIPRTGTLELIDKALKNTIQSLFETEQIDILKLADKKKPLVICFAGINGSGKTTTIAKLVYYLQKNKKSCVIAASDTFRAAAIDQLQIHADKLGVKLIKHDYGADAAAVAFDAIKHAEAKNIDVVLIDTAGRMHSNVNLMDEMKKIIRVAKPDLKIFIGESITGNDCTEQAKKFDEAIGIDGIILSKADIDEKGGASISVSYVTGKPILFLGMGQEYDDLKPFDKELLVTSLGL